MRRRLLAPALASVLLLSGCATQSPESQLVDSYDALVAQANARDVNGLRDAVDAFVDLVHREEGDSLTAQEAKRLIDLANAVKRNAAKVDPPDAPSPEPAPTQEPVPTKEPEKKDDKKDEEKDEDKGKDEEEGTGGESPPPTSEPEPEPTIEVTVGAAEARRSPTAAASPSAAPSQQQAAVPSAGS